MYPINIMFHGAGVVGWTVAGLQTLGCKYLYL